MQTWGARTWRQLRIENRASPQETHRCVVDTKIPSPSFVRSSSATNTATFFVFRLPPLRRRFSSTLSSPLLPTPSSDGCMSSSSRYMALNARTRYRAFRYKTTNPCSFPCPFVSMYEWSGRAGRKSLSRSHSCRRHHRLIKRSGQRTWKHNMSALE